MAMFRDPRQRICSSYYDPEFDFVGDVTAEATPFWRLRAKGANGVPLPHRTELKGSVSNYRCALKTAAGEW